MVPAIIDQDRVAFNAKWRPNGEDLRMQFADHVGSSKCKWNDAGRLRDEARRIAVNLARLPEFVGR